MAGYEDAVLELRSGDRMYLHSDGLHEERNQKGAMFGRDRLRAAIAKYRTVPLEKSVVSLIQEASIWRGNEYFRDDISILAVEIDETEQHG